MKNGEHFKQLLMNGRMSRREFVAAMATVGVSAATATAMLPALVQAATPKRGGNLRFGCSTASPSDTLKPDHTSSAFSNVLLFAYLNRLTEITNEGRLAPILAESWESSKDLSVWTFQIRKGVEFHNAKTLDADDVLLSIDLHRGNSKSAATFITKQIKEMKKDGDRTVVFQLNEPNVDFPFLLATTQLGILPAKDGKLDMSGVGTGAYIVKEFEPGVRARLQRFPNHFRSDVGFVESVELLNISDPTARQAALITKAVDVIDKADPRTIDLLLQQNKDIKLTSVTGPLYYNFPMRTDMAPFDNNDVRMALKYSIDREDLLKRVLNNYGTLGNDHPLSSVYRFHDPKLEQRTYDPDKAKFHLKKAGMANLKVTLSSSESIWTGALDAATLYRESAAKAGIEIEIKRVPNDGYFTEVWMKHPFVAAYWSGRPTEDWMLSQAYEASSNWNDTFWKNDRFNKLLKLARVERNTEDRKAMYYEMQRLLRDQGGTVVALFANHLIAHSKKVAHSDRVAGNYDMDGYRFVERWWLESQRVVRTT